MSLPVASLLLSWGGVILDPIRGEVIQAYAKSVSDIWLVHTPIAGAGFLMGEWYIRRRVDWALKQSFSISAVHTSVYVEAHDSQGR
jgi:hypothetical protein